MSGIQRPATSTTPQWYGGVMNRVFIVRSRCEHHASTLRRRPSRERQRTFRGLRQMAAEKRGGGASRAADGGPKAVISYPALHAPPHRSRRAAPAPRPPRSEEHTSELQSREKL